ncbi:Protein of unknown function DUF2240 [Ferroglobus placidus DSM 10642]|uniref:DUF2240 family protein n=1 Tax=Ferroglobus placidus (strain DSM 10642 / AEDII12DO) TaxID=589924 RepID=D3RWL5_FERPA|nr:DUF2240 family protein [Ferroglobus placidus]ADC64878.1 Protein of unknown function DUF2240 [Ferroglobus placidus DSM 10642]
MLKKTIAAVFKSKGKRKMKKSELTYTLSFDLKWFSHETSKEVVELAQKKGLLKGDDELEPNFDVDEVEVEPDFKPDVNKIKSSSLLDEIVDYLAANLGMSRQEVIAELNRKQIEFGNVLDLEVVALIYAKERGLKVEEYVDKVWEEVKNSWRGSQV